MIRFHAGGLRTKPGGRIPAERLFDGEIQTRKSDGFSIPSKQVRKRISLLDRVKRWPVRDQGVSAMCVPYATAACLELQSALEDGKPDPDRLSAGFLYWACLRQTHDRDEQGVDQGRVSFGDAVRALRSDGICRITLCPDALAANAPSEAACKDALVLRRPGLEGAIRRFPGMLPDGHDAKAIMKHVIDVILFELNHDRPVGIGFPVYPSNGSSTNWNDAGEGDGTISFPFEPGTANYIGGHAVCIIGFDPTNEPKAGDGYFRFRNSVGRDFGSRHAIQGVTGYGYGRVSISDIEKHAWGLLTLRDDDARARAYDGPSGPAVNLRCLLR